MNNEEKAKELANYCAGETDYKESAAYSAAMEMAQWKDEQFDNKLQEIVDYVYPLICGGERLHINEIIGKDMVWKH